MIEKDTISRYLGKASRTMATLGALNLATLGCSDEAASPHPKVQNPGIIKGLSLEVKEKLANSLQRYCNALIEPEGELRDEKIETIKAEIDEILPGNISFRGHTEITPYSCYVSFAESSSFKIQYVKENVPFELLSKLAPLEKEFIDLYQKRPGNRLDQHLLKRRDHLVRMYADQCGLAITATWNFPSKENGYQLQFVYVALERNQTERNTSQTKSKATNNTFPVDCKKGSEVPSKF